MGTVVIATVVSVWFVHRRGLAISLAFNGASFGGVVVTPLLVLLVERFGFAAAMLISTAIMLAVLVPVASPGSVRVSDAAGGQRRHRTSSPPATAEISRAE